MISAVALLVVASVALTTAWRAGLPPMKLMLVALLASAAGYGGALLGAEFWNWLARCADSRSLLTHRYALDGALLMALPAGYLAARWLKLDPWRSADVLAPTVALVIVVLRLGCMRDGCCFGRLTELPWGVMPAARSPAAIAQLQNDFPAMLAPLHAVHPTAAYEALAALLLGGWCWWRLGKNSEAGMVALQSWVLFFTFRLLNDFLRSPTTVVLPWTPLVHALLLALGAAQLYGRMILVRNKSLAVRAPNASLSVE